MTLQVWMESFLALGVKIDNLWSTYLVVQLGIFWFFFFSQRPLLIIERILAVGAHSLFTIINGSALINNYRLLETFSSEGLTNFARDFAAFPRFYAELVERDYSSIQTLIFVTHGGSWLLVVVMIVFRNSLVSYYRRHYPQYSTAPSGA